jgi:hypothetical protein
MLIQLDFRPLGALEPLRDSDTRLDPNYLVAASVGVSETKKEERAHVCNASIAYALGNEAPPYFPERFLACGIGRKVVEAPALEHGLVARRFNSRDLKRVQDSVRTHFDEGVAQPLLLLEIDRDARSEDTFAETDQSVHVGGDKRQVMYVVEQLHVYLRLR